MSSTPNKKPDWVKAQSGGDLPQQLIGQDCQESQYPLDRRSDRTGTAIGSNVADPHGLLRSSGFVTHTRREDKALVSRPHGLGNLQIAIAFAIAILPEGTGEG